MTPAKPIRVSSQESFDSERRKEVLPFQHPESYSNKPTLGCFHYSWKSLLKRTKPSQEDTRQKTWQIMKVLVALPF